MCKYKIYGRDYGDTEPFFYFSAGFFPVCAPFFLRFSAQVNSIISNWAEITRINIDKG